MKKEQVTTDRNLEFLSLTDLLLVKGGFAEEKGKSKETDVYDTREV
jgi:hypothetical protein